jgi:hypothetical protein
LPAATQVWESGREKILTTVIDKLREFAILLGKEVIDPCDDEDT